MTVLGSYDCLRQRKFYSNNAGNKFLYNIE